jgi:hypothetical protein
MTVRELREILARYTGDEIIVTADSWDNDQLYPVNEVRRSYRRIVAGDTVPNRHTVLILE